MNADQEKERRQDLAAIVKNQEQTLIAKEREIQRLKKSYSIRNAAQMQEIAFTVEEHLTTLSKKLKLNPTQRVILRDEFIKILLTIGRF